MRLLVTLVAIAGMGNVAAADDNPFAGKSVLVVPFTGSANEPERMRLSLATIRGVRSSGASAELAQTSAADLIEINGCTAADGECIARIPKLVGVDVIVFGKVTGSGGQTSVVLVRIGAMGKKRTTGPATAVETQAAALFGVANEAETGNNNGGSENGTGTTGDGGQNGGKTIRDGYTGDLGGGGSVGPVETNQPSYGSRDSGLDFSKASKLSWGLTLGGGGAVVLGAVLLAVGNITQGSIDDAETDTADQLDDLENLEDRAKLLYSFGNTFAIAGIITAGVGASLMFYQASRGNDEVAPAGPAVGLAPTRGGVMITVGGRR